MSDNLKPCPFCGQSPTMVKWTASPVEIKCMACGIAMDGLASEVVAHWNRRTPAEQPAPASTGRERIYQVQFVGEYASSIWHDATEDAYNTFMPERRRIVYAAPVAARELDVEAERREFEAVYSDNGAHARAIERQGASYVLMSTHQAWTWWLEAARSIAARSAAQSTATVSTEQAGDATFEYRADAEDIWHKAPLAELEQIASDGFQVRAPSPNNSPVGGKDN